MQLHKLALAAASHNWQLRSLVNTFVLERKEGVIDHFSLISLVYFLLRLSRIHEMQTIVTDDRGACLSRGSNRLYRAKMTAQIKVLFGVYTTGAHGTLC